MEFLIFIGIIAGLCWFFSTMADNSVTNSKYHTKPKTHPSYYHSSSTTHHYPTKQTTYVNTDRFRNEFNEMKNTNTFKEWKMSQYRCQNGQCAWCKCHLDIHSPNTQVDHLKPLCQGGTNDYSNLVLACKSCNYWCKKGNYTWRDRNGTVHNGWSKPSWIQDNPIVTTKQTENHSNSNSYDLSEIPF